MNKGLAHRAKKLENKQKKRNTVKDSQLNLKRFIEVKWEVLERVNGKYRHTGQKQGKGLQIENKVYLTDGHYKYINNKALQITKVHNDIPEWATEELIKKYNE